MTKHCGAIALILQLCLSISGNAQVAINTTSSQPDNSAILDVQSTTRGMLMPRMTSAQQAAIVSPADGLMVYLTDKRSFSVYHVTKGWSLLEEIPAGRLFVSQSYPDTLYPEADYDYIGIGNVPAFNKNFGLLAGQWTAHNPPPNTHVYPSGDRKLSYTGVAANKVLMFGTDGTDCDSCILEYDLNTNQVTVGTTGYIRRFGAFTATTDTINNRIFIFGGSLNVTNTLAGPLRRGYIYNYNTGVKTQMDSVNGPLVRVNHTATLAPAANRLFIWGGSNVNLGQAASLANNSLYAYDPTTNSWATMAPCPLAARESQLAVYDGNDKLIIWGGSVFPTNFYNGAVYTISTNSWTMMSATNAPATVMTNASWTGTEMIVSAVSPYAAVYNYKAHRYNPVTDTWTTIADIPLMDAAFSRPIGDHLWTGSAMLQLCAINGVNDRNILWSYSPTTNSWTALAGQGVYARKSVQAGPVSVLNEVSTFYKYNPTGSTPSYGSVGKQLFYYQKK